MPAGGVQGVGQDLVMFPMTLDGHPVMVEGPVGSLPQDVHEQYSALKPQPGCQLLPPFGRPEEWVTRPVVMRPYGLTREMRTSTEGQVEEEGHQQKT